MSERTNTSTSVSEYLGVGALSTVLLCLAPGLSGCAAEGGADGWRLAGESRDAGCRPERGDEAEGACDTGRRADGEVVGDGASETGEIGKDSMCEAGAGPRVETAPEACGVVGPEYCRDGRTYRCRDREADERVASDCCSVEHRDVAIRSVGHWQTDWSPIYDAPSLGCESAPVRTPTGQLNITSEIIVENTGTVATDVLCGIFGGDADWETVNQSVSMAVNVEHNHIDNQGIPTHKVAYFTDDLGPGERLTKTVGEGFLTCDVRAAIGCFAVDSTDDYLTEPIPRIPPGADCTVPESYSNTPPEEGASVEDCGEEEPQFTPYYDLPSGE